MIIMAITLAQAKELSQDKLTDKVIDEFRESKLLEMLTFDDTVTPQGKSLTYSYNRVTTQPTAGTRAINGEYESQEAATTRESVDLKIMGGSYKIDRAIQKNEKQVVDHVEFQSKQKAKATKAEFCDLVINGDSAVDDEQFDGIEKIITGSTTEVIPEEVIDLSTADAIKTNALTFLFWLRQLVKVMDGAPHIFLMNADLYAAFQSVADIVPGITFTRDELGKETGHYGTAIFEKMGDKPGSTNPIIENDAEGKTSLYALRLAEDGVHGVSPDGSNLVETYLPDFTTPGAVKMGEVEFIAAIAVEATKSAAILRKIKVVPGKLVQLKVTSAEGTTTGKTAISVSPELTSGNSYKYKTAANVELPQYEEVCNGGYNAWNGTDEITATTNNKILIVEVDANNKAKKAGITTATSKA